MHISYLKLQMMDSLRMHSISTNPLPPYKIHEDQNPHLHHQRFSFSIFHQIILNSIPYSYNFIRNHNFSLNLFKTLEFINSKNSIFHQDFMQITTYNSSKMFPYHWTCINFNKKYTQKILVLTEPISLGCVVFFFFQQINPSQSNLILM